MVFRVISKKKAEEQTRWHPMFRASICTQANLESVGEVRGHASPEALRSRAQSARRQPNANYAKKAKVSKGNCGVRGLAEQKKV